MQPLNENEALELHRAIEILGKERLKILRATAMKDAGISETRELYLQHGKPISIGLFLSWYAQVLRPRVIEEARQQIIKDKIRENQIAQTDRS